MLGLVLVSHSRQLVESLVALIKSTVSKDLPITAAGGVGDERRELGTDAVDIQEAIDRVAQPDGVIILMDMGSAILSAETAKELLEPERQEKVILCSAPLVEGAIAAAIQVQVGSSAIEVIDAARKSLLPKQEQLGEPAALPALESSSDEPLVGATLDVTIPNTHGLHLRPATNLLRTLGAHAREVQLQNLTNSRGPVQASSLIEIARLQVRQGDHVRFTVAAAEPERILEEIRHLVETGFGDAESSSSRLPNPVITTERAPAEPSVKTGVPFAVSPGIAIGTPFFVQENEFDIPDAHLENEEDLEKEIFHLQGTIRSAADSLRQRKDRKAGSEASAMLEAQEYLLQDAVIWNNVEQRMRVNGENAARAWHTVLSAMASEQAEVEDVYLRERAADFREVDQLILSRLLPEQTAGLPTEIPPSDSIVICEEMTPTLVDWCHEKKIIGVVQRAGGVTSHGAIMARSIGLPAIGGTAHFDLNPSDRIAMDGSTGQLWVNPEPSIYRQLIEARDHALTERRIALEAAQEPAITKDGQRIHIAANASRSHEIEQAIASGADSIGLFRSEFLFQQFRSSPSTEEQVRAYREAMAAAPGQEITIRLLDIGGDKPAPFLPTKFEANPFLGVRGIRLLLDNPAFLESHLRAILQISSEYQVKILVPMISALSDLLALKTVFKKVHSEVKPDQTVPLGVMIETPAAALIVDALGTHADFFSLGTNDLAQYVMAAERGNPALRSYHDGLHPSVVRLCQVAISSANQIGKPISICGELAGDIEAIPVLIGLGLRNFSVAPPMIPKIKAFVRQLDSAALEAEVRDRVKAWSDPEEAHDFGRQWVLP